MKRFGFSHVAFVFLLLRLTGVVIMVLATAMVVSVGAMVWAMVGGK